MNGEYAQGQHLVEFELAERYGISRHMIREALRILEGEQLVTNDAFRGCSVIEPSRQDAEGIFLIRVSLESVAAALAAYRIGPESSRRLVERARPTREAFSDIGSQDEWDANIHRLIWEIAAEPMLAAHLERFVSPAMKVGQELDLQPGTTAPTQAELLKIENDPDDPRSHRALVAAITCQNPTAARRAMARHLTWTKGSRELRDLFAAAFELG
jgi:DNA-binding GntR family transcriptional regulator